MVGKKTLLMLSTFIDKLSDKNKLTILSIAVGLSSGFAAVLLTWLIRSAKGVASAIVASATVGWIYLVLPGLGMLISLLLVRYLVRDNISHGVTKVLLAVSKNESRIKPHNMWSSVLTSTFTIGFGGSVGAEAPIVYTGAAIGSNFARWMHFSYKDMTLMLGCGAAGALAGIFKAPLAGLIFTVEILFFNLSMSSLLPLLLSTISATLVSYLFTGLSLPFHCTLIPFRMINVPFYLILGVVAAFGSLYFTRVTLSLEDYLGRFRHNVFVKWAACALLLGILIFAFPVLYGEGYDSLGNLLQGISWDESSSPLLGLFDGFAWGLPLILVLVFFVKVVAMTLTNSGGGVGGTFGPTLFEGAILGFLVARVLNLLLAGSSISVPEQNFALVGMAAMMAGVMQAPMTAIFLIAEISGGYELLAPLIIASTVSYGVTRIFEKYSIYSKRIAMNGALITHDNDQAVLTLMKTRDLVKDKYPHIDIDASLRDIMPVITQSTAAIFPVLDGGGHYQGFIDIDVLRKYMFRDDLYDKLYVRNIMRRSDIVVTEDENISSVLDKFDRTEEWRLPVLHGDNLYSGFISKSRILIAYRSVLKDITSE